ncbi:hypothetical protein L210DRAFT_3640552 [Boletus edulis BED1]|uniref:F-box only protein 9 n=1 Tax=Boletus edulis BED1 TaxID=1328754 RepID=A0AAD4GK17_BOLED|nr:hypothetical protein L210DRAFT_3640552 [Boletus edulis BED1]
MNTGGESAELRQFREKWKKEVRHRRELEEQLVQQHGVRAEPSQHKPSSPETHPRSHASPHAVPSGTEAKPPTKSSFSQGTSQKTLHTSHSPLSGSIARAVEIYRSAVQHEQESDLDDALRLYRQAFRLDPDVDRAYFKEEQRLQQPGRATASVGHKKTLSTSKGEGVQRTTQPAEGKESVHTNGILSKVLEKFPNVLTFEPEDDREGVPINVIPGELLLYILRNLDTTTLEHFATVSRKARVLSLDPLLWRDFVYLAYKPPQIPEAITVEAIVDGYGSDYRQTYIEHPRLRLDGVYIAVCHYVRRGLSENAWVNVNHLITYHRYLRFFPDGQVLSLLANGEYQPPLVIPMLKPSLCMKGFYVGDWRLEGSTVLISNLVEQHSHTTHAVPIAHPSHHNHVPQPTRYHFQMTLTLRSKPLGRWNKLDFVSYESVNIEDGEVMPLPLKHERPFWFSKVRSWQGY